MFKYIPIEVCVINQSILDTTVTKWVDCYKLRPTIRTVVRDYNVHDSTFYAKRIFYLNYENDILGVTWLKSVDDFNKWINTVCFECLNSVLSPQGCQIIRNGCYVVYKKSRNMSCQVQLYNQFIQVVIGEFNTILNTTITNQDTIITLPANPNIDFGSLSVTNGIEIPRYENTLGQVSYQINEMSNDLQFSQPFDNGQIVIIKYTYYA